MKVEITISEIYLNDTLQHFLFREKSEKTFNELCDKLDDLTDLFEVIENRFDDFDDFEELLYNSTTEEMMEYFGQESEE